MGTLMKKFKLKQKLNIQSKKNEELPLPVQDDRPAVDAWQGPEKRTGIREYHTLGVLDAEELAFLDELLKAPRIKMYFHLNDETDYSVRWMEGDKLITTRVSECVTINSIRWHLLPGENMVPKPIYEYLMSIEDMRKRVTGPIPNHFGNLGLFTG